MPSFTYPDLPVDGLLRAAAVRDPEGIAVRGADGAVSFRELDARADRVAAYLRHTLDEPNGARVGVAGVLDPVFAATYYGTLRAGAVVVLINPLIPQDGLRHVCEAGEVELAFVPRAAAELLTKQRGSLPRLRPLVVTDADDGVLPADALPLAAVLDEAAPQPIGAGRNDPASLACVQFTTGTTGRPKGVRLTHRNLVANARQTALAHRLSQDSVTVNHLPLYHVMHLNSAVHAGACQVLCTDPDPLASLVMADEAGASHYYGLPARLHRLAADPRLADVRRPVGGRRLTAVLSGGSALRPDAARTLGERLGVPVVQGYGMAELSPLTHCQRPDHYRPGAVGTLVPGTECRLVDVATRAPVEIWSTGEVLVRGPQLMDGYLGEPSAPTDPDGWFATGDVGYLDDDGELHLVDRLADIFKYDNEIVSPSRVERILREDPRVADCIVAEWPDRVHGGLVWAGIVPADPAAPVPCARHRTEPGTPAADLLDAITAHADERLADHEQVRHAELIDAVPRTPTGKPERRSLRHELRQRARRTPSVHSTTALPAAWPDHPRSSTMVTFVNKLTVHGDLEAFQEVKGRLTAYMAAQPGYISHQTLRHAATPHIYLELAVWEDAAAHQRAVRSDEFQAIVRGLGPLATPDPGLYETVENSA